MTRFRMMATRQLTALGLAGLLILMPLLGSGARGQDWWPEVVAATVGPSPFGLILVDPAGWTLYTWDGDEPGRSYCHDLCAAVWLPYVIEGDPVSPDFPPGLLGLIARGDGTWQVTYEGWPLYYFVGDEQPGDANGEGLVDLGERWYVVTLEAPAPVAVVQPGAVAGLQSPPIVSVPQPVVAPVLQPTVVSISMSDFEFRPSSVNTQVGQTVVWTNTDAALHTATSDSGVWDTGPLGQGGSGSFMFTTAGTFAYHCAFHPWVRGTVNVFTVGAAQPLIPGYVPEPPTVFSPYAPPGVILPSYGGAGSTLSVLAPDSGIVTFTWAALSGAQSYRVYQTTASQPFDFHVVQVITRSRGILATSAAIGGLAPRTTYLFQVRAVNASGVELPVPVGPVGLPGMVPPYLGAPSGLEVTAVTSTTATLSWVAVPGASGYEVLQSVDPAGPFTRSVVTSASATTAMVTRLTPTTTHYFEVRALDAAGNVGLPSGTASATPGSSLEAPTDLTVLRTTATTVVLTWRSTPGATRYQVYQALTPTGPFTPSTASMASLTTATVTGLVAFTTYYFQVRAVDIGGILSLPSNTVTAVTWP